jgi:hypothetical protein
MNYLVMPATHFFSLPDYIFQDLRPGMGLWLEHPSIRISMDAFPLDIP